MAKKKIQPRRVPRGSEPRMFGDGKPSVDAGATTRQNGGPATPAALAARTTSTTRPASFAVRPPVTTTQDYSYVIKDLRRLGILAAGTFGLLILLGLFIR